MPLDYNYTSQLQKYKIAICTLFKNTVVNRRDSNNLITKQILVPILGNNANTKYFDYANSQVVRDYENMTTKNQETNIAVPQMVLTLTDMKPDLEARSEPTLICDETTSTFIGSPHKLSYSLTILTRRLSDTESIIESLIGSFLGDKKSVVVNLTTEIQQELIVKYTDLDLNYPESFTLQDVNLYESVMYFEVEGARIFDLPVDGAVGADYSYDFELTTELDGISQIIASSIQ